MWYRASEKYDKQRPSYEVKVIGIDAEYAIRKLLFSQGKYNPSDVEIEQKIKLLLSHLENKYGSLANVRLYAKSDTLEELVSENVYELFGKVSNKK